MASLIGGRLGRDDYVALMRNLHAIYAALEAALNRHPAVPALAVLGAPHLHREAALAADLNALCGAVWQALPLAPAAQAYVARLESLAHTDPILLTAHAYVRYLGDLHGGQMLKRLVARSLAVAGEGVPGHAAAPGGAAVHATRFYEFGSGDEVLALRQAFRDGLAQVAVDAATADRLVAEARWAFERHVALFTELDAAALSPAPLALHQSAHPPAHPPTTASA